ncbi:spore coat protein A [Thermocatellispora tengchongensis]|uniref:Spore coat protein A n=1 Tax=Thermocatellispora tengchongensis TaxID=1073253 RepID=A0A840PI98_9ACTN|nr:multicopper oxidase domain-containing protein [Thermocatellispora tengchongensis]MBB5138566.1 spore coat protein A [Thermocatellispora tengchongensis]
MQERDGGTYVTAFGGDWATRREALAGAAGAVLAAGIGGRVPWAAPRDPADPGEPMPRFARAGDPPADSALVLHKFVDRLPIPPVVRPERAGRHWELTIRMRAAQRRMHSQMPPTPMWTYEGVFPGPTIEVWRGQRVRIAWENELAAPFPVLALELGGAGLRGELPSANRPGHAGSARVDGSVRGLPPWAAVHVHGARTGGGNDGWAENAVFPGDAQLSEYPNDQPATTLWYHDHAMHLTRFTLYAGLIGMYLIRDKEEESLGLPSGRYELPLVLCDRNFDLGADGRPNGRLLYKLTRDPSQTTAGGFFLGPYNVVNGVVWPYTEVEPRWYRLRVLNASNARTYRLMLLDRDGRPRPELVRVIGTDGGLLGKPAEVKGAIVLSPAERADLLVDFRPLAGQKVCLSNTYPGVTPGKANPKTAIAESDLMRFHIGPERGGSRFAVPAKLSDSFRPVAPQEAEGRVRWIVLPPNAVIGDGPAEIGLWEMVEVDPRKVKIPSTGVIQVKGPNGRVVTLKRVAGDYADGDAFVIPRGGRETWRFLSLGRPPHPMHLHMVRFQVLGRDIYDGSGWNAKIRGTTKPIRYVRAGTVQPHERGWKDVVRLQDTELVTVTGRFDQVGRYVYHCHILEHEMHMMRPYVVMPPEVLALHHHGTGGGRPGQPAPGRRGPGGHHRPTGHRGQPHQGHQGH